jgi:glycosidase
MKLNTHRACPVFGVARRAPARRLCRQGFSPVVRVWLVLLVAASCRLAPAGFAAPPVVSRIEPPNWWPRHPQNPVRLLIAGANLQGARIEAPAGFTAGNARVNAAGTFALLDLHLPAGARPGPVPLRVTTAAGEALAPFALLQPLPSRGRFAGFSPDDVIYLLMPDRFANGDPANDDPPVSRGLHDRSKPRHYHGGDLCGVMDRLSYLRKLGVTALWLTPWYDNVNHLNRLEKYTADNRRSPDGEPSTDYHGYGAVDFYGVEEHFGDLTTLRRLVNRAHATGLKVIQDQVANHTGPYHLWTINAPTPTWFNGTVANHLENRWDTWTIADPNAPEEKRRQTLEGWFINLLPDLNQNDPETAAYLIQNSLWWIGQTGLDAVRQDTLPYVPRSYWARWTAALKRAHPRLTILGEMWDGNPKLVAFFQGGRAAFDGVDSGIDTLFDFPLHYALRDVFAKGRPMTRLAETLAADTNYVNARVLVTFLGLHDTPRFMNEDGASVAGLKLAFTGLLTLRGTPLIYYGDEIAMRGGADPDNRRDFPGGWPDDPRNAFTEAGRTPEQAGVFNHVQKLLRLRRQLEPLRRGDLRVLHATADAFAFTRTAGSRTALVAFNNGQAPVSLELTGVQAGTGGGKFRERLAGGGTASFEPGTARLRLPPRSAAIYSN